MVLSSPSSYRLVIALTTTTTTTTTTFYYYCCMILIPGLPGWSRRNIRPLTYPDHHPTFFSFLHLLWSIASSLFNLRALRCSKISDLPTLCSSPNKEAGPQLLDLGNEAGLVPVLFCIQFKDGRTIHLIRHWLGGRATPMGHLWATFMRGVSFCLTVLVIWESLHFKAGLSKAKLREKILQEGCPSWHQTNCIKAT